MKKMSKSFSPSWATLALLQQWTSTINATLSVDNTVSLNWMINSESDLPIYQNFYQNVA